MRTAWILSAVALLGCGDTAASDETRDIAPRVAAPFRGGVLSPEGQMPSTSNGSLPPNSPSNGIEYHGGPVMVGGVNIYIIWYGTWTGNSATTLLPAFLTGLSGSSYWNINSSYYDGTGTAASNTVTLKTQVSDASSQGTSINMSTTTATQNIILNAINTQGLAQDANGIYFVLAATNITDSSGGFCGSFCGWHTYMVLSPSGTHIKYAIVPNAATACPMSCAANLNGTANVTISPNGNVGADAMASVIAHEASETLTDPELNGWFHLSGSGEDGDLCAWKFGTTTSLANGSMYNVTLGANHYLSQQIQSVAPGGCVVTYP